MAMYSVALLITFAFIHSVGATLTRQSRWWINAHSQEYIDQALQLVTQHRSSLTGVYMYYGFSVSKEGKFSSPTDSQIVEKTAPFLQRGLTVGIAIGFDQSAVQSGAVMQAAVAAAETAQRNNITSLMVDYEPSTNNTEAHAQAYAAALSKFAAALHGKGVKLDMCVSSWSILVHFDMFQRSGVDSMMSMASTYYGKNVTSNEQWVEREQAQGVSPDQLRVGIGSTNSIYQKWNYQWDEHKFQSFMGWLETRGVQNVDLWRTDIDTLNATNGTAPWIYSGLSAFLQGAEPTPRSFMV